MTARKKEKLSDIVAAFDRILAEPATAKAIRTVAQNPKHPKCIQAAKLLVEYVEGLPIAKLEVGGKIELVLDIPGIRIPLGESTGLAPLLLPAGASDEPERRSTIASLQGHDDRHLEPGPSK